MEHKGKKALIPMALAILMILVGGGLYLSHVQRTLWKQSVSNVLEVTVQGGKAFEVYVEQGNSMLEGRAANFAQIASGDAEAIGNKLDIYEDGDPSFAVIDLTHGMMYFNSRERSEISAETREEYLALPARGILEPFLSEYTGRRVVGYYEKFVFADGAQGMVRKAVLVSEVSKQFALSFYDGAGFSYIVNAGGDIMLRSGSEGNRTFQNVFDVLALDKNTAEEVEAFREGMSGGKRGVMRLNFDGREHILAFVPLDFTDGFYLVSIVPNSVIMEHNDKVMLSSQVMLAGIVLAMFIFIAFLLLTIHHRRQVQEKDTEVRYREQLFNLLANNTNDVFLMLSEDCNTVKYVSPNVERVLGVSREALEKDVSCLQSIIHGLAHETEVSAQLDIAMDESAVFEGKCIHKATGETRWFMETVYHTAIQDMERYIVVLADRTEDKQKETALTEALQIAKVANEAKSTFLANMSHDIRTPMNTIVGLTTLLQRDANNPEMVLKYAEKLTSSSQHLLGLINNVLDMSKIENGKTSLNIGEFNLAKLIQELDSIIRLQTRAKQQTFDITVQNIVNEDLIGDKQHISQVMINILSNAVKYTPADGRVSLNVRQLGEVTQGIARIQFIVADNGIGMSKEYQQEIFQPFTREISTTVNQIQGTGLGMAITKNLVELMGGTISVESEQGVGSTFTIEFDLRVHQREDDAHFWEEHHISNVLVVDDERDICTGILNAMAGTGVETQCALDGVTALRMAQAAHQAGKDFDLILMDWIMPEMDGLETAREIREMIPVHIPIVLLTACDWEGIHEDGITAGIDGFLSKPFFLSNFKEVIHSVWVKEQDAAQQPKKENSIAGRHFLCAEDNELNAEILVALLDMEGASAVVASNGQEALEKFTSAPAKTYDAILMDVQMPVMNGYEATRAIRASGHPEAAVIPIVAMTANAFADDVRASLDSGMNAHLAKPVDMKKLLEVLNRLWDGE